MTPMTAVVLGVDTHKDVHVGVVVDLVGRTLGTRSVATTQAGHDELEQWATSFGPLLRAGIEGACAYGAGLARFLTDRGHQVVEVARPNGGSAAGRASTTPSTPARPPAPRWPARARSPRAARGRWR